MSITHTACRVAAKTANGFFRSIYIHYDGDPDHVGEMLKKHYSDKEKLAQLLDLGDCMCLGPEIGRHITEKERANFGFSRFVKEQCIAYGRDKNESGIGSRVLTSFPAIIKLTREDNGADWLYVYVDGVWDEYEMDCDTIREIKHANQPDPDNPCIATGAYIFLPQYQIYCPGDIYKLGSSILVRFNKNFMHKGAHEPVRQHTYTLTILNNCPMFRTDGFVLVPEHCLQEVQQFENA